MRAHRSMLWSLCVLLLCACGSAVPSRDTTHSTALDGAIAAWSRGALDQAGAQAWAHLASRPESTIARELAARVALAQGDAAAALEVTRDERSEPLVRLRAAAHLARDEYGEAAIALGSLPGSDDDPWARTVARLAEATRGRALHQRAGAERAELALRAECALPVVAIRVDGRDALALIATSVHLTVLAPELRAEHGVADELELDRLRVRDVPFVVRDLSLESAALGVPILAVLGADLLTRIGTTIDGPGGRVILGAPAPDGRTAHAQLDGSVLAVRAGVDARDSWMLLDTAGAFAVALSPRGAERLGLAAADASEGASARIQLGDQLLISDVPLQTSIVGDELEESTTAPIDGAIGWGLLAQLVVTLDRDGVSLVAEAVSP